MIFYEWYSSSSCRWNDLHMFVLDIFYKVTKNSWRSWFIYVWITYRPYNLLSSNYLSFQKIRIRKYNGNKGVKFVLIRNEHSSSLNSFFLANQGERMNEICKFDPLLSDGSGDFFGEKIQLQSTNVDFEFCHHPWYESHISPESFCR